MSEPTKEEMLEELDDTYISLSLNPYCTRAKILGAIRRLIESQPEVDEEFIEEWAKKWADKGNIEWEIVNIIFPHKVKQMLQEAGVRIKEKP